MTDTGEGGAMPKVDGRPRPARVAGWATRTPLWWTPACLGGSAAAVLVAAVCVMIPYAGWQAARDVGRVPIVLAIIVVVVCVVGLVGSLFAVPLLALLSLSRERLTLGADAVQAEGGTVTGTWVWLHVPYANLKAVHANRDSDGYGRLVFDLIDPADPGTFVLDNPTLVTIEGRFRTPREEIARMICERCPSLEPVWLADPPPAAEEVLALTPDPPDDAPPRPRSGGTERRRSPGEPGS